MSTEPLEAFNDDGPDVGVGLDVRTHYAHARYAMLDQPGTIWYDPRDGNERLAFTGVPSDEGLEVGERVHTGIQLHARRQRCQIADPNQEWVLIAFSKEKEEYERRRPSGVETYEIVHNYRGVDTFEHVYAARSAARERFSEYAGGEYVDAVEYRLEAEA